MKFDNVSRAMTAKRPAKKCAPGLEFFFFFGLVVCFNFLVFVIVFVVAHVDDW